MDEELKRFMDGSATIDDLQDEIGGSEGVAGGDEIELINDAERTEGVQNRLATMGDPFELSETHRDDELALPTLPKDELELLLDGFPPKRIEKVREIMASNLGKPSLLRLVPVLRENMPEHVSKTWLRKKNLRDANFVMESAEERGVVDRHLLASMLEVVANSGSVDKTISFYEEEIAKKDLTPTAYFDRIVPQMLIDKKRIGRALKFRDDIESRGKHLDLISYASLVSYYGNHGQLGSALLTLKECQSVHSSPPGEKSLSRLRTICRKLGVDEEEDILKLIGRDPIQWLKEGQQSLKREYSKKGRRQVGLPGNRLLQA